MRKGFSSFDTTDTYQWFEREGVALKTEEDGRVFPESDQSLSIIFCLENVGKRLGIAVHTHTAIDHLREIAGGFEVGGRDRTWYARAVVVTTGGHPKLEGYDWLAALGHTIVPPVPSLFTFNLPGVPDFKEMAGISVEDGETRLAKAPRREKGALLITHWGLSGPAALKLSAWEARTLAEAGYMGTIEVNWLGMTEKAALEMLKNDRDGFPAKKLCNLAIAGVPRRLFQYLYAQTGLSYEMNMAETGNKHLITLAKKLTADPHTFSGKTTFKDEFVTCGGIDLAEVDAYTMESKKVPSLYFAGEVLDIDAITGGFNFQAAWTTGFMAGQAIAKRFFSPMELPPEHK